MPDITTYDLKTESVVTSGLSTATIFFGSKTGQSQAAPDPMSMGALTGYLGTLYQPTLPGDASYSILNTDAEVVTSAAFTAARTWTLPAADTTPSGKRIRVADYIGTLTASNTLTVARAGSDTINGATSLILNAAYASVLLESNGSSKWTVTSGGQAVSGILPAALGGTGVANGSNISLGGTLQTAGAFTAAGAFGLTLTLTAATSITLPTTGTLATLAGTEALTNKTIGNTNTVTLKDTLFTLQDDGDATKLLAFQLSGITTGTTRTFTVPDASGTLALTSNKLSAFAATTSAELAGVISDETGSGALVFGTSPTFTTGITSPLLVGGAAAGSTLTYMTTTGVGSGDYFVWLRGANGGTEAMRLTSTGLGLGTTPAQLLHLHAASGTINARWTSGSGTFDIGYDGSSAFFTNFGAGDVNFSPTTGVCAFNAAGAEVFRTLSGGNVKFTNAANFAANSTQTVTITNVGPAAIGATIAKWLKFQDSGGTVSYVPVWQ